MNRLVVENREVIGTSDPTPELTRICGSCGADRKVLHQSLHEGPESENYHLAVHIVESCQSCKTEIFRAEQVLRGK